MPERDEFRLKSPPRPRPRRRLHYAAHLHDVIRLSTAGAEEFRAASRRTARGPRGRTSETRPTGRSSARGCAVGSPTDNDALRIWRASIAGLLSRRSGRRAGGGEGRGSARGRRLWLLPLDMMQKYNLIEKYAEEAGLKVTVSWSTMGGPAAMNDALLSGSAHLIWRGRRPSHPVGPHPQHCWLRSIPPSVRCRSPQRPCRAVEVARRDHRRQEDLESPRSRSRSLRSSCTCSRRKKYGRDPVLRFDPNTVTMAHPDALIALTSGNAEFVGHWASAPFDQRELKEPAIHTIMDSDHVMGGSPPSPMMSTTANFRAKSQTDRRRAQGAEAGAADDGRSNERRRGAAPIDGWKMEGRRTGGDPRRSGTKYTTKPDVPKYAAFTRNRLAQEQADVDPRALLRYAGNRRRQLGRRG